MSSNKELGNNTIEVLIEREEAAWQKVLQTDRLSEGPSPTKSAVFRHWWHWACAVLRFYTASHRHGVTIDVFPERLLERLANMADDLSAGHSFTLMTDAKKSGNAFRASERRDIRLAVAYKIAVAKGELLDQRSTKTVAEAYGVSDQTVRNWVNDPDKIFTYLDTLNLESAPEIDDLPTQMKAAGKRYRTASARRHAKPPK